jgi:hypothetical protein
MELALGWLYIFSNPSMPGLVKIGFSTRDPSLRIKELDGTGVPTPFRIIYWALVEEPDAIEKSLHEHLKHHRVSEQREFFKISELGAIQLALEFIDQKGIEVKLEFKINSNEPLSQDILDTLSSDKFDFRTWKKNNFLDFDSYGEFIKEAQTRLNEHQVNRCFLISEGLRNYRPLLCLTALQSTHGKTLTPDEFNLVSSMLLRRAGFSKSHDFLAYKEFSQIPSRTLSEPQDFLQKLSVSDRENLNSFYSDYKSNLLEVKLKNFPDKEIYLLLLILAQKKKVSKNSEALSVQESQYFLKRIIWSQELEEHLKVIETIRRFLEIAPKNWLSDNGNSYIELCKLSKGLLSRSLDETTSEYIDLIIDLAINFNDRWDAGEWHAVNNKDLRVLINSAEFSVLCKHAKRHTGEFKNASLRVESLKCSQSNFQKAVSLDYWL